LPSPAAKAVRTSLCTLQRSLYARLGDEPGRYRKARSTGRCTRPQSPTSLVFDLDLSEPAVILDCGRVALHLKRFVRCFKLAVFRKVSGCKGLHLIVPLNCDSSVAVELDFKSPPSIVRQCRNGFAAHRLIIGFRDFTHRATAHDRRSIVILRKGRERFPRFD
jgi:hypothetical protein